MRRIILIGLVCLLIVGCVGQECNIELKQDSINEGYNRTMYVKFNPRITPILLLDIYSNQSIVVTIPRNVESGWVKK